MSYVAFSRATNINNILLPQGISLERLQKNKTLKKNIERIKEEQKLQVLNKKTIDKFNQMQLNSRHFNPPTVTEVYQIHGFFTFEEE